MSQKGGALFKVLFGLLFLGVGVGAGFFSCRTLLRAEAMRSWTRVPATVLACNLKATRGSKGGYSYCAQASYQYEAGGVRRTSSRVSLYTGSDNIGRFHHRVYEELKRCMDGKRPTVCWVNPKNPEEVILIKDLRPEMLAFMQLFVLAFGGAGLWVVLSGLATLLQRSDDGAQGGLGHIRMRGAAMHRVAGALAVAWNGYMAWCLWRASGLVGLDGLPWYLWALAGTGVAPAAVAGYLIGRIRKFGVSVFEMSPLPGVLGGPVSGTIRIPAKVETDDGFDVVLQCVHQYTTGSGKQKHTHRDVLWEESRHLETGFECGEETMLPVRFAVPYDRPATTAAGGCNGYYWRLNATAAAPGIDYKACFDVPVRHTPQSSPDFVPQAVPNAQAAREAVDVPIAREGLRLTPNSGGGFELVFPAGRPRSAAVGLSVFIVGCTAVCVALWTVVHAPLTVAVFTTFFDAVLVLTLASQFCVTRGVEVAPQLRELVTWTRFLGGRRRECRFSFAQVLAIRSERAGQTGNTMLYRVVLVTEGGHPVTVGSGLSMWNDAEDVAKLLRAALEPGFVLQGLRV